MPAIPELRPTEFCERWPAEQRSGVVLLDVREPAEVAVASVAGALHIPMREVPERLAEIDRRVPVVVMCHAGSRSRRVAEFLLHNGFAEVFNLNGGIDAWSTEIDPRVPRY